MKIEKGSVKALFIEMFGIAVAGIILWPILDMLYCAIFTHSEFVYSVNGHIVQPIIFGCVAGLIFWVIDRISMKKNKKKK